MSKKATKKRLYWERLKKSLTISELSELTGLSDATISRAENGVEISKKNKKTLCEFFEINANELL